MTRGLVPPDTLSEDDVRTLRVVRRDIYTSGLIGGGLGSCAGLVMYTGAQYAKKYGFIKGISLNKNTAMLSIMGCFALGMFLGASKTGIEEVHILHPIFRVGAIEPPENSLNDNGGRRLDYQSRLKSMRMARRKTLMDNLQHGHGLSDSHSGRWVEENSDAKFEKE